MIFRLGLMLLWLCCACGVAHALPQAVREELKRAHIPLNHVSVVIQEIGAKHPLLTHNAAAVMNPASTMKLLTTYAGLSLLGPTYRWKTEVYLLGELRDGVLAGDLLFKGYGDPKLTIEQFWLLLRELRQRGLREIRGNIVLDRSFFALDTFDPAAFDQAPSRAYNVGPDALLLNFAAIRLRLSSQSAFFEPPLAGYNLVNRLTTAPLPCHVDDAFSVSLQDKNITLEGKIPQNCAEIDDYVALLPANEYFSALFISLWRELGGSWQGKVRDGVLTAQQAAFTTFWSAPLAEQIRDINKFSNNTMARQLFLALGASGRASTKNSYAKLTEWLKQQDLAFAGLVLENGSGLSRVERIAAQDMATLLRHAAYSPFAAEFVASLPILGLDGTVKKRFKNTDLAGLAHLKTGSLEGVRSLAGYVYGKGGKQWVLVFNINDSNAKLGQAAQDALIEWLLRRD